MFGFSNEQSRGVAMCVHSSAHSCCRDEHSRAYYTERYRSPDQNQGIHTPKPAVPALRHLYLEKHNDTRSTLGLLPHQSVDHRRGMDATLDGRRRPFKPAHVMSIKPQCRCLITIKHNASAPITAVMAPHAGRQPPWSPHLGKNGSPWTGLE